MTSMFADLSSSMRAWRHAFHRQPELGFDVPQTAARIIGLLRSFGIEEIYPDVGRSGIVALIHGETGASGLAIGLRSDMDALPIGEIGTCDHRSLVSDCMHACGHDGHMAMLLGAAEYLSRTRRFLGTVALIFQPAEEEGGGARAMVDDGIFDRFGISEVYALHNMPGLAAGTFATNFGSLMASADRMEIAILGVGGHSAYPHKSADPIVAAAALIGGIQQIVSRNTDPLAPAVLSVTRLNAGVATNVIPDRATMTVDIRTGRADVRDDVAKRLRDVAEHVAAAHGCAAELSYHREYPVTVNDARSTRAAADVAVRIAGLEAVRTDYPLVMAAEDFAVMLEERPGCLMFIGNGDGPGLHHPAYDFNDHILPVGSAFLAGLVEHLRPER